MKNSETKLIIFVLIHNLFKALLSINNLNIFAVENQIITDISLNIRKQSNISNRNFRTKLITNTICYFKYWKKTIFGWKVFSVENEAITEILWTRHRFLSLKDFLWVSEDSFLRYLAFGYAGPRKLKLCIIKCSNSNPSRWVQYSEMRLNTANTGLIKLP